MDRFSERYVVCEHEVRRIVGIETESGEFKHRAQTPSPLFLTKKEAMIVLLTQQYARVCSLEKQTAAERERLAEMLRNAASLKPEA